jgi:YYY domain-containing protein
MAKSFTTPFGAKRTELLFSFLLVLVLLAGAYLRVSGLYWGEYTYMHPDERFLIWVGTDISPVESFADYWDTANSSLNPHNRGHGFYVYGTLPMFLARYAVEWVYGHSGFNEMTNVGRALSALADLLTVLLVYLVGARAYDRRVGLLAAAFSAFAVLQIQHAHFFTMDTFTTLFTLLAIYFAVRVWKERVVLPETGARTASGGGEAPEWEEASHPSPEAMGITQTSTRPEAKDLHIGEELSTFVSNPLFLLCLGFGLALGMAVASKINAAPLALLLPAAMLIRLNGLEPEAQRRAVYQAAGYLALAAFTSLLAFRIFQPYAFSGPGFFDILPNQAWLANLNELRNQASGDVDFPPALQWARRPVWFAWQNMVLWGMGLPLGLLAWSGFLWVGWRILRGEWRAHALLWGWTAIYFTWQSLVFNPSMRYQLLVYPTLALFAAWAVVQLHERGWSARRGEGERALQEARKFFSGRSAQILAIAVGGLVLLATAAYALAFTSIYTRPFTRVAASRWIYQNVPGPINVQIQTGDGVFSQPLPFPYEYKITPELPYLDSFTPQTSGMVSQIVLGRVIDPGNQAGERRFLAAVSDSPDFRGGTVSASIVVDLSKPPSSSGPESTFALDQPLFLNAGQEYFLRFGLDSGQAPVDAAGMIELVIQPGEDAGETLGSEELVRQSLPIESALIGTIRPYFASFTAESSGLLIAISVNELASHDSAVDEKTLALSISALPDGEPLTRGSLTGRFSGEGEVGASLSLDRPLEMSTGQPYYLKIEVESGSLTLQGSNLANEGAWDDGLPLRLDGHDGYGGIYTPGLNFDMYEDDNPNKRERFYNILDQADYLLISSSRQWGTLPRLPERFPMTTVYYRSLMGCPPEHSIEWCYNVARPGDFQGGLGYELVQVFQSNPTLGPVSLNDQPAEEAFTVYDHPKVFIFEKQPDYDPRRVRDVLGSVDLSRVIHLTPRGADRLDRERFFERWFPFISQEGAPHRDMMLPAPRLEAQRTGGTWSEIFDTTALQNRWPAIGAFIWYLALFLIGVLVYPLVRLALSGLPDRGYPLARTAGLLLTSYLVWLAGSFQVPFSRLTISAVILLVALVGASLGIYQRAGLRQEWRERWRYFLTVEGLFLAFFLFDLVIRLGNPDLWHPWKGGERPMDFSYFNAVLKSTTFPPYDPWFAGGYINYYYFGFVLVAVLTKWLGIVPANAYNLILPTFFSLIALGAFSAGWNLISAQRRGLGIKLETLTRDRRAFVVGMAAALGMAVLGNLATLRMIYQGYQRLAAPGGDIEGANILVRLLWAGQGMIASLLGDSLPYSLPDWYWIPSRAIPAPNDIEPITEFPFFTVLYGDPHAHLFALPLTLLALAWALSLVFGRAWEPARPGDRRSLLQIGISFLLGGLAIGSLRPTNTWDLPTYLLLGLAAVGYASWRAYGAGQQGPTWLSRIPLNARRTALVLGGMVLLTLLSFLLFQPFGEWYVQGYTDVDLWKGTHTPFWSYLTHWGLFLFVIVSWMIWETRDWMASTPLSELRRLEPYRGLIYAALVLLAAWIAIFVLVLGAGVAWFVLPLAAWAGLLAFRPRLSDSRRAVLFMVVVGLLLTLMVEVVVLVGDIGRMNTVFKFYLQVWTLLAVSAAAALGWLLAELPDWSPSWRSAWQVGLTGLVAAAALYPLLGTTAKIKDRMAPEAPNTLDGMAFMRVATYNDLNVDMDLNQDYQAIRWMQENIEGSPVIVEANMVEYRWGTRYTIYTGLPNVVGWNWHQRQQRARAPEDTVPERVTNVGEFYLTNDPGFAQDFLKKYSVRYIVVGQLERAYYPGPGLDKFEQLNGTLWRDVFRDGGTVIYEVMPGL